MRTKPPMWRQWQDADFCDLESLSKQLERELNEAKELMATAANWVEACPFDNSIIFAEKLRAAAQPNIRS